MACKIGHLEIVKLLLEMDGIDVNKGFVNIEIQIFIIFYNEIVHQIATSQQPINNSSDLPLDIALKRKIDLLEKDLKECEQLLSKLILNDQSFVSQQPQDQAIDLNSRVNELTLKRNSLRNELLKEYQEYNNALNHMSILSKKKKLVKLYEQSMDELSEEDKFITHSLEPLENKSQFMQVIINQEKEIDDKLKQLKEVKEKIDLHEEEFEEINP
ncbi:hypothetical protein FDP41_004307 [Naegleria fowleri]|uniref:Uncharacterized protein n=1 Tax=Naegleria fowleri TaxID=5763 RepID=A0A6A5BQA6_NAEFO|nr:uncharacterized protein FDP41_004307 [Naegleria fowleri]KAF0976408.1 hypothetical protein FDP41_004307 [Naegleria fowleri]